MSGTVWSPLLLLILGATLCGQTMGPGRNSLVVRGQEQDVYYYPADSGVARPRGKILFAPGDGGWRGFAITVAQTLSSWGYDVYGIDTKRYLTSFTCGSALKERDVPSDVRQIADATGPGPVTLLGWSEGAGLMALAAASPEKSKFTGLITMGLGDSNVLGWKFADNITYLTGRQPNEPTFSTLAHVGRISPLPVAMISSTNDEYVSPEEASRLFQTAQQPKRYIIVNARNHRFDGNREGFFRELRGALQWIGESRASSPIAQ